MVCPNCKREVSPQARVCPTCGTPVAAPQPVPTVVVAPPYQGRPAPTPPAPTKKKKLTAARVFTVIFCLLAAAANIALIVFWFLPSIQVTSDKSASSMTVYSMFSICRDAAPYLSIAVCVLCALGGVFSIIPLFKGQALKRNRMLVPKLTVVLCAVCYAVPYCVAHLAKEVDAYLNGGDVYHNNPFTVICFWLFVLLCVTAELTISNRNTIQKRQIEDLKGQLLRQGVPPEPW